MKNEWQQWVAQRLATLRESRHLTQREVAEKLKMKLSTYASYEEARAEPSLITLKRICHFYDITTDQFYEGSPAITYF